MVEYFGIEHHIVNLKWLKNAERTISFPENPFHNDNQDAWGGWGRRMRFILCMKSDFILYRTEYDNEYGRALEVIRIRDEFLSAVSVPRLESEASISVLHDL